MIDSDFRNEISQKGCGLTLCFLGWYNLLDYRVAICFVVVVVVFFQRRNPFS